MQGLDRPGPEHHQRESRLPTGSKNNSKGRVKFCANFLLALLDADIDKNAIAMIELMLEHSKALQVRPGPWRETWNVEYFLKALEENYVTDAVDKVADDLIEEQARKDRRYGSSIQ